MANGDNGCTRCYIDQATGMSAFSFFQLGETELKDCFPIKPGDIGWYAIYCRWYFSLESIRPEDKRSFLVLLTGDLEWLRRQDDVDVRGVLILFRRDFVPETLERKLNRLPLFHQQGFGPFQLNHQQGDELQWIFDRIWKELASSYPFERELLLCLLLQVVHFVIKNFTSASQSIQRHE